MVATTRGASCDRLFRLIGAYAIANLAGVSGSRWTSMNNQKLSILLAVYNGGPWLDEAIRSVIGQSWTDWELIIVDNGSTDDSFATASRHAAQDRRVKAFRLDQKGKNLAYNHAFAQSDGAYVTYFAADDVLPPDSLEKRLALILDKGPRAYSTCAMRTQSDEPKFDGLVMPRDVTRPNFSGGVLLFSRDLAELAFPLPTDLPNEDTWTQLHLRAFGRHWHYPAALYAYRIHGNNSFGYHVPYKAKKEAFLRRMRAYELFHEKYRGSAGGNAFIATYVGRFVEGLAALREGRVAPVLLSPRFPLTMKLLFAYYSSPLLYRLRAAMFRVLSGRMIQI